MHDKRMAHLYADQVCNEVTAELIRLRRARDLKVSGLATLSGLHRESLYGLERGDNLPTLHLSARLCWGLQIRVYDLVYVAEQRVEAQRPGQLWVPRARGGVGH